MAGRGGAVWLEDDREGNVPEGGSCEDDVFNVAHRGRASGQDAEVVRGREGDPVKVCIVSF